MLQAGESDEYRTSIIRHYVDTRPFAPVGGRQVLTNGTDDEHLPLIETLPQDIQHTIRQYKRRTDRYMSLSSALLKYFFIHRTARIPWSEVKISRTPKPHSRPYWSPPRGFSRKDFAGLEFNVSHQAGLIVLVGCKTPNTPRDARVCNEGTNGHLSTLIQPDPTAIREVDSAIDYDEPEDIRIGVDIACTWEPPRSPDLSTQEKFDDWVDVFTEMFSLSEQKDMKALHIDTPEGMTQMEQKARRFYTYWALKEAYIKMVGEGLLASWLRDLQFRDVPVPRTGEQDKVGRWTAVTNEEMQRLRVLFKSRDITRTMKTDLEGFERNYVIATMTRGVYDVAKDDTRWMKVDLEREVRPCAEGTCSCLC